jgi:hypothetical protein
MSSSITNPQNLGIDQKPFLNDIKFSKALFCGSRIGLRVQRCGVDLVDADLFQLIEEFGAVLGLYWAMVCISNEKLGWRHDLTR